MLAADRAPQVLVKVKRVVTAESDKIASVLAIAAVALMRSLVQTYLLRMP